MSWYTDTDTETLTSILQHLQKYLANSGPEMKPSTRDEYEDVCWNIEQELFGRDDNWWDDDKS